MQVSGLSNSIQFDPCSGKSSTCIENASGLGTRANSRVNCRRKMIMNYFHEKTDYTRCGTCDCCINAERFKGDQERDMYPMASLIIMIVRAVKGCPMSQLLPKVKGGNSKESYLSPLLVQRVQEARNTLPNSLFTDASLKEIVAQLVRLGYLKAETKSTAYRKYLSYNITKKGSHAIEMQSPIMMPVLAVVRENEQVKEEQKIQRVKLLEDAGIDTNLIPPTELQVGAGPSVTAHLQWLKYLKK
ncbi:hypothetical protein SARC_04011 [Sphaeroforma arctica JP610]|uniref:ATP-dependent DNA helicase RecQ zinc-binding domain-containing protein n=1 Tax=Sphaeroforma arctica JP610 TaxID=667725 RepID=A0A0L0G4N1_9EUKA|nr:hypothetical protein SARC_04011 [Sphaeroforma arctica JP610]KNC83761.1 hypothetical protein SARC_04011 [Sphaeroforma arctica JP610]|eukprot:XP_014157663.1 hypothetical protein SARC_04011 [Sphaeroforma arctica JP610]